MKKLTITTIAALLLSTASGLAQVSDDVNVDLTVTAQPSISITPGGDLTMTSDGVTVTSSLEDRSTDICFETGLTDVRISFARLNPINNSFPSLVNSAINDYVNYSTAATVLGVGNIAAGGANPQTDVDLTNALLGSTGCGATQYRLAVSVAAITAPQLTSRSIPEVVADNNLDDGTPYVFSDVLTITFEPAL